MILTGEFRSAAKHIRRGGWVSTTIVVILALAIGAATAVFSVADAVLIRPLPVTESNRVLVLWGRDVARAQQVVEVSLLDRRAWLAGQKSFSAIALFGSVNWGELYVSAPGPPFHVVRNAVSAEFFDVLGARPMLGRTFRADDDRPDAPPTVVVSAAVWRRHFSSDQNLPGRFIAVGVGAEATTFEVIGVMPDEFRIPAGAEVWTPLGHALRDANNVRAMYAVGRLAPGVSPASAVAELSTIARNEEVRIGRADTTMVVVATPLMTHLLGPARPALLAIAGASCALLLIACANAAGLLLVQGVGRSREIAVRVALGARRVQIVRQLLSESVALSLIAGALGVGMAYVVFGAIISLAPIDVPRLGEAAINLQALLFALAVSLGTAITVGLLPALRHSGTNRLSSLIGHSRSATSSLSSARTRRLLVAGQLALVVVLLTAASLFTRSLMALRRLDLGFDPRGVLTFSLDLPAEKYDTRDKRLTLVDRVIETTGHLPNVVSAGAVFQRPFANGAIGMDSNVVIEGQLPDTERSNGNPILNWEAVTPDYFRAMDIRLLQGRSFADQDTTNTAPVVIIGQSLAGRLWPGQDPIGRRVRTYGAPQAGDSFVWQTVIGVVEDAKYREVEGTRFDVYLPHRQAPNDVQHFMVRLDAEPRSKITALRTAIASIDPDIRLDDISTMDEIVGHAFAPWRFTSRVVSTFAAIALMFAITGIATLVAFAVTQRSREIGVRVALGARPLDVVRLVAAEGARVAVAGLATGLFIAWSLRRSVESILFGVRADDATSFVGTAVVLGVVFLGAAYLPARKAARVDPCTTLRSD